MTLHSLNRGMTAFLILTKFDISWTSNFSIFLASRIHQSSHEGIFRMRSKSGRSSWKTPGLWSSLPKTLSLSISFLHYLGGIICQLYTDPFRAFHKPRGQVFKISDPFPFYGHFLLNKAHVVKRSLGYPLFLNYPRGLWMPPFVAWKIP